MYLYPEPAFFLRPVVPADISILFDQQRDPEAVHMAAFTAKDPDDETAYLAWMDGILAEFLREMTTRPLRARVAKDNHGSLRVLEKCGFAIIDDDRGFANARGVVVEEWVLQLA